MISFFNRHKRVIFIATTATFLGGVFVGLGAYVGRGQSYDKVAMVGDKGIPYARFVDNVNRTLSMLRDKGLDIPDEAQKHIENQVLQELIVAEALEQCAREFGLRVTDLEVAAEIQNTPAFQKDGVFNDYIYKQMLWRQLKLRPAEYEAERRRMRLAAKFRQLAMSAAKVTPGEVKDFYLASGKKEKDFAKDEREATKELLQMKAAGILEGYLKQFLATHEVKNFLEERQKGA